VFIPPKKIFTCKMKDESVMQCNSSLVLIFIDDGKINALGLDANLNCKTLNYPKKGI
jgi:hypothetical protein